MCYKMYSEEFISDFPLKLQLWICSFENIWSGFSLQNDTAALWEKETSDLGFDMSNNNKKGR